MIDVQRRVLRVIAVGLGIHEEFFDTMLEFGATLTRAIHYPPMDTAPDRRLHVGRRARRHQPHHHASQGHRARPAGAHRPAAGSTPFPPDGSAIINTGMMLEHLTNGVIGAGIHRVVAAEGQSGDRYSVVQFAHPTPWTILQPLPTCVTDEHPLRFPTITSADALDKVIWEINLVEDGRRLDGD